MAVHGDPAEVITDRGAGFGQRDRGPGSCCVTQHRPVREHQYENNRVESDHGRLKARLGPMRGLKTNRTASVVIRGHAFIQNLRRGHYELAVDTTPVFRLATAFDELRPAI
jgi:IS6 family transposase